MLKMYCQECGSPTPYLDVKPKFCSSCGNKFDKSQNNQVINNKNIKNETKSNLGYSEDDYDNDNDNFEFDDEITSVPNINKIDFEVSEVKPLKVKMSDILTRSKEDNYSEAEEIENFGKPKKPSKKKYKPKNHEFLKKFQSEAGTLRPLRKNKDKSDG